MNIAIVIDGFSDLPAASVTNQIHFILSRGHTLRIIFTSKLAESKVAEAIDELDLLNKAVILDPCKFYPGFEISKEIAELLLTVEIVLAWSSKESEKVAKKLASIVDIPFAGIVNDQTTDTLHQLQMPQRVHELESANNIPTDPRPRFLKRIELIATVQNLQRNLMKTVLNELEMQLTQKNREIEYWREELFSYRRNIAWKITRPLRKLTGAIRNIGLYYVLQSNDYSSSENSSKSQSIEAFPRKILYVLNGFPKLSETFILNEIVELESRGISVQIIALQNQHEKTINRKILSFNLLSKTRWLGTSGNSIIPTPTNIKALYGDVDIVHAHFADEGAAVGTKIASILKRPFSITAHAYELFQNPRKAKLRKQFNSATAVITPSEYNRAYIRDSLGYTKDNVSIIRATINADDFAPKSNHIKGTGSGKRIISVARLVEKKGMKYLIQAMEKVLSTHPSTVLNIIGSGPLENSLRGEVAQKGLGRAITFLGDQSNEACADLISQSDIAVLACIVADDGDRDVCPLTIQEAMAMGLPVISTTAASVPELVDHRMSGILVPERDAVALSKAIIELIDDEVLAQNMGSKGREKIETEFNIKIQVDRLVDLWSGLLAQRSTGK